MKVIVAGCRDLAEKDREIVFQSIMLSKFEVTEIVSGGALGVDSIGELWAKSRDIPIKRFVADWKRFGMKAGPIRNGEMARYADALVAVWDGESRGTANMITQAISRGLEIYICNFRARRATMIAHCPCMFG